MARTLAAGVTWTSRTTSAPWAGRAGHTSVIDAAGAIYIIGGCCFFDDVWTSTDGGARTGLGQGGWSVGTLRGYYRGTQEYLRGKAGVLQEQCRGTKGVLGGTTGYFEALRGTKE